MGDKALAKALAGAKSKSQVKRHLAQSDVPNEAWQDAVDELYEAIKSGDQEGFKETLKAVIEIASNGE